ncbi:hypothetical protein GNI_065240 [Gregarina niphandrodes]|uniref:Uncharacterized protein n=1 Tax=Gregarina niphandrodes TaxID=110365 RepID=A0A023B7V5_GRENI|nr:hypothetical protein GNI_065240 [Gregarina niphandrodes]EZG67977.1 hypothetical protein GNI_065240 [Gregarina niphandrodes]|eukprot:XP_011130126.1 hypothetical protein GNI_065240 [Gregarina niphandrodes]
MSMNRHHGHVYKKVIGAQPEDISESLSVMEMPREIGTSVNEDGTVEPAKYVANLNTRRVVTLSTLLKFYRLREDQEQLSVSEFKCIVNTSSFLDYFVLVDMTDRVFYISSAIESEWLPRGFRICYMDGGKHSSEEARSLGEIKDASMVLVLPWLSPIYMNQVWTHYPVSCWPHLDLLARSSRRPHEDILNTLFSVPSCDVDGFGPSEEWLLLNGYGKILFEGTTLAFLFEEKQRTADPDNVSTEVISASSSTSESGTEDGTEDAAIAAAEEEDVVETWLWLPTRKRLQWHDIMAKNSFRADMAGSETSSPLGAFDNFVRTHYCTTVSAAQVMELARSLNEFPEPAMRDLNPQCAPSTPLKANIEMGGVQEFCVDRRLVHRGAGEHLAFAVPLVSAYNTRLSNLLRDMELIPSLHELATITGCVNPDAIPGRSDKRLRLQNAYNALLQELDQVVFDRNWPPTGRRMDPGVNDRQYQARASAAYLASALNLTTGDDAERDATPWHPLLFCSINQAACRKRNLSPEDISAELLKVLNDFQNNYFLEPLRTHLYSAPYVLYNHHLIARMVAFQRHILNLRTRQRVLSAMWLRTKRYCDAAEANHVSEVNQVLEVGQKRRPATELLYVINQFLVDKTGLAVPQMTYSPELARYQLISTCSCHANSSEGKRQKFLHHLFQKYIPDYPAATDFKIPTDLCLCVDPVALASYVVPETHNRWMGMLEHEFRELQGLEEVNGWNDNEMNYLDYKFADVAPAEEADVVITKDQEIAELLGEEEDFPELLAPSFQPDKVIPQR